MQQGHTIVCSGTPTVLPSATTNSITGMRVSVFVKKASISIGSIDIPGQFVTVFLSEKHISDRLELDFRLCHRPYKYRKIRFRDFRFFSNVR